MQKLQLFLNSFLIILSILCFLMGYAFLNNKAENILMVNLLGKIKDRDGYKKWQGKFCIIIGIIFLLAPLSIYLINKFNINRELINLWYVVLAGIGLLNALKTRKYFK